MHSFPVSATISAVKKRRKETVATERIQSDLPQIKVAIGHDCRNNSRKFAEVAADVFSANGIKVYLFDALRPTPEVSFAIRELGCQSGVILTASHNPKEYNGYKAYWNDGAQMIAPHDKNTIDEVNKITSVKDVKFRGNAELIEIIGEEIDRRYLVDEETGLYYYGARYYDPHLSLWMSTDPMQEKYPWITSYCQTFNNPIRFIDPNGEEGDNAPTLYHNTQHPGKILRNGFNATKYGKLSSYNWFSTIANASGTGRTGSGVTLAVEGIDVSHAVEVKNSQMREFYLEAKAELGYTSSQLRQSPELKAKVDALKYKKLGKWMDAKGASVYKLGNTYAISDHVANNGTVVQIFGPKNLIKGLNGIKIAGRVLTFAAVAADAYEIYSSRYNARTVTSVAGGWAGAWAGAKLGCMAGTSIGFAVGGVGEVVGAPAGALIGGFFGYISGRKVSETVYDVVTQKGMPIGGR